MSLKMNVSRPHGQVDVTAHPPMQNTLPALIIEHDLINRCTLVETRYGTALMLPLREDLPRGAAVNVAISSNDIALSRHYIDGISIQNQIHGRICAIIPNENNVLVQVDCGNTWLVRISLKAYRDMKLQEGDNVYCLAKTQAFSCWPTRYPV